MDKATAIAYPIKGILKYHGFLTNPALCPISEEPYRSKVGFDNYIGSITRLAENDIATRRIPYHTSISANMSALRTETTVMRRSSSSGPDELYMIKGDSYQKLPIESTKGLKEVIKTIKEIAGSNDSLTILTRNLIGNRDSSYTKEEGSYGGKGVGFSSSGGAGFLKSLIDVFDLDKLKKDVKKASKYAAMFSSSSARSYVGGIARLHVPSGEMVREYAFELEEYVMGKTKSRDNLDKLLEKLHDSTYAECIGKPKNFQDYCTLIYPVQGETKTDKAHAESITSELFGARVESVETKLPHLLNAIKKKDIDSIGWFAEKDSNELHAVTMTGNTGMIVDMPETSAIRNTVRNKLRRGEIVPDKIEKAEGYVIYAHQDTGPSVFVDFDMGRYDPKFILDKLHSTILSDYKINLNMPIISEVGGPAFSTDDHLKLGEKKLISVA